MPLLFGIIHSHTRYYYSHKFSAIYATTFSSNTKKITGYCIVTLENTRLETLDLR